MDIVSIVNLLTTVVTVASVVAATTPTPKDDVWVAKFYKIVDLLAVNIGKAKEKQMATVKRSSVALTTTSATEVGQAGANGGAYNIHIVNVAGTSCTVTVAVNSASATIADVGTVMATYSVPSSGSPTVIKGLVLAADEYVNAEASHSNVLALTLSGYDQ